MTKHADTSMSTMERRRARRALLRHTPIVEFSGPHNSNGPLGPERYYRATGNGGKHVYYYPAGQCGYKRARVTFARLQQPGHTHEDFIGSEPCPDDEWMARTGIDRPCTYPCGGHPVLKTKPDGPYVSAHKLPRYIQCSECGYAPLPEDQPALIDTYLATDPERRA